VSGGCKQGPWTLWNAYAEHFIDEQGRVVDPQGGGRTTSEGQSYALFFALADNDRGHFDRVLAWTQANLAGGNMGTHLPGWLWGRAQDGQWKLLDSNSAADSDCWIAYSLIEAGHLWHSSSYSILGHRMMAMIAKQEVTELPGFGIMLMPGPTALWVHNQTWTVNPSYVPLFLFDRFAQEDPAGPWGAIAMNIPNLLRQSARHGFVMDWADYVPSDGFYPAAAPVSTQPGKATQPAGGSYDAIRVYLWAGMLDSAGQTRTDLVGSMSGMATYLANHGAPPEKVSAEGVPSEHDGPVGFSAAVLPYLKALPNMSKTSAQQRVRMGEQLDPSTGLYGKDPAYYDQNLLLFATGFLNARFRFGAHGELNAEWTRE
jgi:endoglucanase